MLDLHTCYIFWNQYIPAVSTSMLVKSVLVKYYLVAYSFFFLLIGLDAYEESWSGKKKKDRKAFSQTGIRATGGPAFQTAPPALQPPIGLAQPEWGVGEELTFNTFFPSLFLPHPHPASFHPSVNVYWELNKC